MKTMKTSKIILLVVVILIVGGSVGAYYYINGKKKSSGPNNTLPPQNRAPVAEISVTKDVVYVNEYVNLSANKSYDPDGDVLYYYWDFDDSVDADNDGDAANDKDGIGVTITTRYSNPGQYRITLTVSDGKLNDIATRIITVLEGGGGEETGAVNVTFLPPVHISSNPPITKEQWKLTVSSVEREESCENYTIKIYHNTTLLYEISLADATEGNVTYRDIDYSETLSEGDTITIFPSENLPVEVGDVVKLFYLMYDNPSAVVILSQFPVP